MHKQLVHDTQLGPEKTLGQKKSRVNEYRNKTNLNIEIIRRKWGCWSQLSENYISVDGALDGPFSFKQNRMIFLWKNLGCAYVTVDWEIGKSQSTDNHLISVTRSHRRIPSYSFLVFLFQPMFTRHVFVCDCVLGWLPVWPVRSNITTSSTTSLLSHLPGTKKADWLLLFSKSTSSFT